MRFLIFLPLLLIIMIMTGCASYTPPNNVEFAVVDNIGDFCGTYKNQGISEKDDAPNRQIFYLSALIWNTPYMKSDASITMVTINRLDENSLTIKAIGKNGVEKEKIFVRGKDFELENGRIFLKSGWGVPLPIVGIGYKSSYLGLDLRKNGKFKERTTVAGLLALIFPIALSVSGEVRFERIENPDVS